MLANYQFYRSKIAKSVKVMAMVKAFSYGSGSFEIANLLQYHQIDYLAVAYADEGVALRKAGILLPIMVMSPEPSAFETMMRYQLEPEVYSLSLLNSLVDHLSMYPQSEVKIHIKLDTGMHRLGFEKTEIHQLKEILNQHSFFRVASVFTHLVASDDAQHDDFTRQQFELFEAMYHELVADFSCKPLRHVLNTSGISRWPEKQFDMVRLGIGLYGFDSVAEIRSHLQPVASLKTTISQIKHLKAGETVGYGRNGLISQDSDIATVKIGYADGYSRGFGNGIGKMLVNGEFAPTVGSICMDMCMINISGIEAKVGDEVIVFNEQLTIDDLAQSIGTIAYEILTNVSQRVKRVYYYE
jgi:alanine racemase